LNNPKQAKQHHHRGKGGLLRKPNHRETERSGEGKASGAQKQRAAYEPTTTTKTPPAIWTTVMLRASAAQRTTNLQ
jgi:hypothetical protein